MRWDEYARFDAVGLGALLANGEVTALELIDACEAIVDALDGRLNAVVSRHFDIARENAPLYRSRAPFHGIPFGAKEEGAYYDGIPSGASSRLIKPVDPGYDTNFVTRYKEAGLNLVAKLNMPELAASVTTESLRNGICRNPWNPGFSTGGSSGGSAAAVAAGYFPAAYANDGAGSIRIPSSCCGLFGFKPSRGRVPKGPVLMDEWAGFVVDHVITRTVRDSALILDVESGVDVGAPYDAPVSSSRFAAAMSGLERPLRIGVSTRAPTGTAVHPDCVAAAESAAQLCQSLGHVVEEGSPELDGGEMFDRLLTHLSAHLAKEVRFLFQLQEIDPDPAYLESTNWRLFQQGLEIKAVDYIDNLMALGQLARRASHFFEEYDVWLSPALAKPSLRLGELGTAKGAENFWNDWAEFTPFTPLANIAGQPAMSVPLYWSDAGMPVGVQFQAKIGNEAMLFALAGQLEAARPWADRTPPVSARALLAA